MSQEAAVAEKPSLTEREVKNIAALREGRWVKVKDPCNFFIGPAQVGGRCLRCGGAFPRCSPVADNAEEPHEQSSNGRFGKF